MIIDDYVPLGKLVDSDKQSDGSIIETYEVIIFGERCRYLHLREAPKPHICRFTGNEISEN